MKTDALFYELFRLDPKALFQLIGLDLPGEYTFDSVTVKMTEKRFDGVFKPQRSEEPHIFLEVQGYYDPQIYWRLLRAIATYYESRKTTAPFLAIVLFIHEKFDPGDPPFSLEAPCRLIRVNLEDCFSSIEDHPGVLTVLKPFVFEQAEQLEKQLPQWKSEIQTLHLPQGQEKNLIDLLEYAILQKFPKLNLEEIQTMLKLTPLEQTVAGQQLIQIGRREGIKKGELKGREEGRKEGRKEGREEGIKTGELKGRREGRKKGRVEGIKKGELIGRIQMFQEIFKQPITPEADLTQKSQRELKALLKQLQSPIH